ncbi:hypothetical protein [Bradyrhizobium sp. McL0615]|uniref:hypothetical protein n=1 Tax=Bradyrhizobium sp. McL0615 TaxID=3415673 RepID=UPI003CFA96CF
MAALVYRNKRGDLVAVTDPRPADWDAYYQDWADQHRGAFERALKLELRRPLKRF